MSAQGTPEWLADRAGKVTASRIADVMASAKSGEAAARANYRAQLVAERLTGKAQESFTSAAMQWGTDNEPVARAIYEVATGSMVDQVGFVPHQTIPMSGASPDGLVGDDGLIEIKCPNTATHIDTLISGKATAKYLKQMQWQMECTGRLWCDFVSYDPRMPDHLALFVVRVYRDEELIDEIRAAVVEILADVEISLDMLGRIGRANGISGHHAAQPTHPAGASPAVQPAVTDNTGSISPVPSFSRGDGAAPDPAPAADVAPVAASVIDKQSVVIEHQDGISAFLASRDFAADSGRVRAILVEFVKFQAEWNAKSSKEAES